MVPGRQPLSLSNVCRHRCRGVHPLQNDCGHGAAFAGHGPTYRAVPVQLQLLHSGWHIERSTCRWLQLSFQLSIQTASASTSEIDAVRRTVPYVGAEMVLCARAIATVDWQRPCQATVTAIAGWLGWHTSVFLSHGWRGRDRTVAFGLPGWFRTSHTATDRSKKSLCSSDATRGKESVSR